MGKCVHRREIIDEVCRQMKREVDYYYCNAIAIIYCVMRARDKPLRACCRDGSATLSVGEFIRIPFVVYHTTNMLFFDTI